MGGRTLRDVEKAPKKIVLLKQQGVPKRYHEC
jgi:hypothetical protein